MEISSTDPGPPAGPRRLGREFGTACPPPPPPLGLGDGFFSDDIHASNDAGSSLSMLLKLHSRAPRDPAAKAKPKAKRA